MSNLLAPYIKEHFSHTQTDYPDYWRVSSAGYCYRYNIFKRLGIPQVQELEPDEPRKQATLGIGTAIHEMMQKITRDTGLSVEQESEIKIPKWDLVGHFDDLFEFDGEYYLYDYKTTHSGSFKYKPELKPTHRLQLGTYMYALRDKYPTLKYGRIMEISKDDFLTREIPLEYDIFLETDIVEYWTGLNQAWKLYLKTGELPECTCNDWVGSWFATRNKHGKIWNSYFMNGEPCSIEYFNMYRELTNKEIEELK